MIDNYKDAEKFLNELRNNDEMLFRMAISHLMDVGIRNLTEENVTYTLWRGKDILRGGV